MDLSHATVIDVRTQEEFASGNVKGSVNIPIDQIQQKLSDIKQMQLPLILCCASGGRSNAACHFLYEQGITDIYDGGPWQNVQSQLNNA